jgi:type IV fimbrial biogenesis protein FimT
MRNPKLTFRAAHRERGVTLIELMTAVVVLAILLGIGVPSFRSIMRENQIAAQSNNLLASLTLARSEAIKRGVRVSVCAANANGNNCAGTASWGNGWILFADDFGSAGAIDASDTILQRWPAAADGVVLASEDASVTFARTGRAEFARSFIITKQGCTGQQLRTIDIGASGRVNLRRQDCSVADEEAEAEE